MLVVIIDVMVVHGNDIVCGDVQHLVNSSC